MILRGAWLALVVAATIATLVTIQIARAWGERRFARTIATARFVSLALLVLFAVNVAERVARILD